MNIDAKQYLIVGAGVSGLSVVEYFAAQGKDLRIMDTRELPPNAAAIKALLPASRIAFGALNPQWIQQADVIVLSPGVAPQLPEIKQAAAQGAEVIGDIELFARTVAKPYLAITGSNGKSTVTMLVREILSSQGLHAIACANIGEPALAAMNTAVDIYVLELSSFQLETCTSLAPLAAVVLNISDDHLDRHESLETYAQIKSTIYADAKHKVFPRDRSSKELLPANQQGVSFGLDVPTGNDFGVQEDEAGRWLMQGDRKIIASSELSLLGTSGENNVLAALALTQSLINDESQALVAIKRFTGLPHRCERVAEDNHVLWINDSKGTNVGATVAAIKGFDQPLVLIVGGVHKGGSLDDLCAAVRERVSHVIVFGQDKQVFIDALNECSDIHEAVSIDDCVQQARQITNAGQVVLFSPACASFDMFANYIQRGDAFTQAVFKCIDGESNG